jgi:hypothetical protein
VAVEVHIVGTPPFEIRRIARLMREQHRTRQRQINAETREQIKPLQRAISAQASTYLPSGYAPTMSRAIRVQTLMRATGLRVRVYARGHSLLRAVNAINSGLLRHKLFGNPLRWYDQSVTPGFVDNPVHGAAEDVYRGLEAVAERIRQRVERG